MKKLLRNSLFLIPIITVSLVSTSCVNNQPEQKPIPQLKENPIIQANEKFANNPVIKNMYSSLISKDKSIQSKYIKSQDNINTNHSKQVNYALRWFVPMLAYLNSDTYVSTTKKNYYDNSKNIILETLNENWYWYLKNIDAFKFIYNPYEEISKNFEDPEYLAHKNTQILKKFPSLSMELNSNEIKYDWAFGWKTIKNSTDNKYHDIEAHYLVYDLNHVIRYWKYTDNEQKIHIQLIPDLYYVENVNSYNELKNYLQNIEDKLFSLRQKQTNEAKDLDLDTLQFYNDQNLVTLFASKGYNYLISKTITDLNNENKGFIYRFTWRSIDV